MREQLWGSSAAHLSKTTTRRKASQPHYSGIYFADFLMEYGIKSNTLTPSITLDK